MFFMALNLYECFLITYHVQGTVPVIVTERYKDELMLSHHQLYTLIGKIIQEKTKCQLPYLSVIAHDWHCARHVADAQLNDKKEI